MMHIWNDPEARAFESFEPTPLQMRRSMGSFASGVTIVSGLEGDEPVGFACQSFASVSLEPPLVLFCADHRGRAWPRIQTSGRFSVHVLAEDQGEVCARFGSSTGRKFDGLDWARSAWDTPSFADALLRVHCEVEAVHVAGDHDIVIGRVLALESPTEPIRPMLFYRGRFGVDDPSAPVDDGWGWGNRWG